MTNIAKAMMVGAVKTTWDYHLPILSFGVGRIKGKYIVPKLKVCKGNSDFLSKIRKGHRS